MEQAQTQCCSQGTQTEVTLINQKSFLDDTVTDDDRSFPKSNSL